MLTIAFIFSGVIILEFLLRFPMLFSFIRSTQRVVSKYINEFLNDMNINDLDRQHFVDKVLAGKLFQIAGWGTIVVSFMTSIVYVLQYGVVIAISVMAGPTAVSIFSIEFFTVLPPIAVAASTIIQVFSILPSILYCIFLIMLWLYFRDKTKVKYSGYRSNDPEILVRIHRPNNDALSNQDKFHFTYYKRKYTVMYTTYVVCIVVISALFAGFFAPVLENKWEWDISLGPGDYFLLDGSVLKSDCYNNQFEIQVKQISLLYPIPSSLTDLRCKENMFAGESRHNETHYTTTSYYNTTGNILWLPNNSVSFQNIDPIIYNYTDWTPSILVRSQFPCYFIDSVLYMYEYSKDSCKGAELIQASDTHTYEPDCNYTSKSGELNCTIRYSGVYNFDYYTSPTITVKKSGTVINESNAISLNKLRGEQLHKYDIIVFNATVNNTDLSIVCSIHATCRFHPAFRILMPVLILLSSMLLLTISLILILKI